MGLYQFGKNFRLLKKADFEFLKTDGKRIKSNYFFVVAKSSRISSLETRIGISVSRKVGNSCWRNCIKRMVRESFRHSPIKRCGSDLLFVALPGLRPNERASLAILQQDVQYLFEKIKKMKNVILVTRDQ